jgi:hypothetical protein
LVLFYEELYTKEDLFPHIETNEQLLAEVCQNNTRPPIPNNCPLSFKELIQGCWNSDPIKRPSMMDVLNKLKDILIDVAIDEAPGRIFWKSHFLFRRSVDWTTFSIQYSKYLEIPKDSVEFKCMRLFLNLPPHQTTGEITLLNFGNFLRWFGPSDTKSKFMENMKNIILRREFHLRVDKETSESLLAQKPVGTYILRFSSEPGSFGLSCVKNLGSILHFRINYIPNVGYSFGGKTFISLDNFVEEIKKSYTLTEGLASESDLLATAQSDGYVSKVI